MHALMAIVVGVLFASGVYLILRRNAGRLIVGIVLLAHGVNLLIFTAGGLSRAAPPIVPPSATLPPDPFSNPLPQALILTAIVIGLAAQAFFLVLIRRAVETFGSPDLDAMTTGEQLEDEGDE